MIHYGLAEGGQEPLFVGKLSGSVVMTGRCDRLEVTNGSVELYSAISTGWVARVDHRRLRISELVF